MVRVCRAADDVRRPARVEGALQRVVLIVEGVGRAEQFLHGGVLVQAAWDGHEQLAALIHVADVANCRDVAVASEGSPGAVQWCWEDDGQAVRARADDAVAAVGSAKVADERRAVAESRDAARRRERDGVAIEKVEVWVASSHVDAVARQADASERTLRRACSRVCRA